MPAEMELTGMVERQRVARGSKSEHVAVVLRTPTGTFWLRRRGGHAFRDPVLERLVGTRLQGEGSVHGNTFIVDRVVGVAPRKRPKRRARRRGRARRRARALVTAPAARAAASPSDPFRHVVLLMLENRSFDHMVGVLQDVVPGLDGVPAAGTPRTNPDAAGRLVEQRPVAQAIVDPDPKHETPNVLNQIDEANGRFVKDYERAYHDVSAAQKGAIMAYHRQGSLPALHRLGREFAVCDKWFCSVPGSTWTNRLFAMSGTSLGRVKMPEGLFHPNLHAYDQPSLFRRLEGAGRSLRIYFGDFPLALLLADRRRPSAASKFERLDRFFTDAARAEAAFPDFAFVEPRYLRDPNDDHPPHDVGAGQRLIAQVYEALRANQALWESTLLVVAYDEHGGFYDHVGPPAAVPPDSHRDEYTFDRLGVRVPVLLVSPWIEAQVVHTACDHTALLRSLQVRWGLGDMGQRVARAPDILASLRLTATARTDTPRRLLPAVAKRRARARRPVAAAAPLNDHQRAIVAFSAYLETQTPAPARQKVRAAAKVMRSPADARAVAENRARRYLAQLGARSSRRRTRRRRRS